MHLGEKLRRGGRPSSGRLPDRRAGLSLLEVLVTLSILAVAGSLFCQLLVSGRRVRLVTHEKALAADAARVVIERMRNRPFLEVYRTYNEDPSDDPGGNGTGPGASFDVVGLSPAEGASSVGRIYFPSMAVTVTGAGGGAGKLGGFGGGGGASSTHYHLRENLEDARLGMPRDLTGDNKIDDQNHSSEYLILPLRVRIEWKSGSGLRSYETVTQLGDFRVAPQEFEVIEDTPLLEDQ
jgi:prepilin-type N-terminal cleavage/methylation domain-containing protein